MHLCLFVFQKILTSFHRSSNDKKRREYIDNLTELEILYLLPYVVGETTITFSMMDGVRGGLEAKDIIYRAANVGSKIEGFAYNIQPWALDYLRRHPETYERHVGKVTNWDDLKRIYKNGFPWEKRWV